MKSNRIWSQRSEAIAILAQDPTISGTALVEKLFNSTTAVVEAETLKAMASQEAAKPAAPVVSQEPVVTEPVVDEAAQLAAEVDRRLEAAAE